MRWLLAMLAAGAACSSAQHAHTPPKRHAEPARSGWEGGVSEPQRMDDLSEVAPVEPLDCGNYFQSEDPEDWTEEHINCIVEHGVSNQMCKCMESKMENRFWER